MNFEKDLLRRMMQENLKHKSADQKATESVEIERRLFALIKNKLNKKLNLNLNSKFNLGIFSSDPLEPKLSLNFFKMLIEINKNLTFSIPALNESGDMNYLRLDFSEIDQINESTYFANSEFIRLGKNGKNFENQLVRPDMVLVPGICFDLAGFRIGRGKGYFDRYLTKYKVFSIGLAFDEQVVESCFPDPWDQKISALVTNKLLIESY